MKRYYDVSVVGGGPIGGYVAGEIASKGFEVAIFEKKKQIGEPLKCAGLVTSRVFNYLDIPEKFVVQNKIRGACIHSPSGYKLIIGGDRIHALVIDRPLFDNEIIKSSIKKGAKLFLENKVLSIQKKREQIEIKTSKNDDVECKILIGADGPYSRTRDRFALSQPTEILRGVGAEITNTELNPEFVEIFVGNKVAPGFFAWIIPTNEKGTEARIGLCIDQRSNKPPIHYFSNLFKNKYSSPFLKNIQINKKIGGSIPLGPLKKTYSSNLILVGDAAAQIKPTSGGGIYTGLLCGRYCSSVVIEALQKNNFTSRFLKKYHKLWSNDIGMELYMGMKFRKIFKKLNDKELDKYIEKFQNEKTAKIISKYGDIDYPSKLVKHLIKTTPSLLKLLPDFIKK